MASQLTYMGSMPDAETRRLLEEIKYFEHQKLIERCPYKRPRYRIKKSPLYIYDPNQSDKVTLFQDITNQWR